MLCSSVNQSAMSSRSPTTWPSSRDSSVKLPQSRDWNRKWVITKQPSVGGRVSAGSVVDETTTSKQGSIKSNKSTKSSTAAAEHIVVTLPAKYPSCPPGLEKLIFADHLFVRQGIRDTEPPYDVISKKKFEVLDGRGKRIYLAKDSTDNILKLCCKGGCGQPFRMSIKDQHSGYEILAVNSYPDCYGAMTACISQNGMNLGFLNEVLRCCSSDYIVIDAQGNEIFRIYDVGSHYISPSNSHNKDIIPTSSEKGMSSQEVAPYANNRHGEARELKTLNIHDDGNGSSSEDDDADVFIIWENGPDKVASTRSNKNFGLEEEDICRPEGERGNNSIHSPHHSQCHFGETRGKQQHTTGEQDEDDGYGHDYEFANKGSGSGPISNNANEDELGNSRLAESRRRNWASSSKSQSQIKLPTIPSKADTTINLTSKPKLATIEELSEYLEEEDREERRRVRRHEDEGRSSCPLSCCCLCARPGHRGFLGGMDACIAQISGGVEFEVYSCLLGKVVGKMSKTSWEDLYDEGFNVTDCFGMSFPKDLSVRYKALLLAALFLLDINHF